MNLLYTLRIKNKRTGKLKNIGDHESYAGASESLVIVKITIFSDSLRDFTLKRTPSCFTFSMILLVRATIGGMGPTWVPTVATYRLSPCGPIRGQGRFMKSVGIVEIWWENMSAGTADMFSHQISTIATIYHKPPLAPDSPTWAQPVQGGHCKYPDGSQAPYSGSHKENQGKSKNSKGGPFLG